MILIFAPCPGFAESDGFSQRVAEIDKRFGNRPRAYVVFESGLTAASKVVVSDFVIYFRFPRYLSHHPEFLDLVLGAQTIYVHSVFNFVPLLGCLDLISCPLVLDYHGVVSAEFFKSKKLIKAIFFYFVEFISLRISEVVIVVSQAMGEYVKDRNPLVGRILFFPVLSPEVVSKAELELKTRDYSSASYSVVYAGGSQDWQLPHEVVFCLRQISSGSRGVLLSFDLDVFSRLFGKVPPNVTLRSVNREEATSIVRKSNFFLALREDNLINRVACPTKIAEGISLGALPVFRTQNIGDFKSRGLKYVKITDFLAGRLPVPSEYVSSLLYNLKIYEEMSLEAEMSWERFLKWIDAGPAIQKTSRLPLFNVINFSGKVAHFAMVLRQTVRF